ncbi:hypothetical protein AB3R30_18765 [Leptolyngbyaceae cyanobacterium UHCC 1019]
MARPIGATTQSRAEQPAGREALWLAMRFLTVFTTEDLMDATEQSFANSYKYCSQLLKAGYLRLCQRANGEPGRLNQYRLIRNSGALPPIPAKNGSGTYDPNTGETHLAQEIAAPDSGRQKSWDLLRAGGSHTAKSLSEQAGITIEGARRFLNSLAGAGYLGVECGNGRADYKRYWLVRNSGDLCPVVRRNGAVQERNRPSP